MFDIETSLAHKTAQNLFDSLKKDVPADAATAFYDDLMSEDQRVAVCPIILPIS